MIRRHFHRIWNTALTGPDRLLPRTRLWARPMRIHISVNDFCNLRCPHCLRHVPSVKVDQNRLHLSDLERIAPWFRSALFVAFAGLGEPFLQDDLLDMVDLVHRQGATASIITNATRLDETVADRLCSEKPTILNLSIDAATPEVFEKVRLGARFHEVAANIDRIADTKRRRRSTFPILSINMTLMRDTLAEIEGVVDLADRWGASEVVAQTIIYHPETADRSQKVSNREAQEALRRAHSHAERVGVAIRYLPAGEDFQTVARDAEAGYDYGPDTAYHHRDKALIGEKRFFCPNLWHQMNIDVFGRMMFCCMADFGFLGDIHDTAPERLWNHPDMVALRRRILRGDMPEDCLRCFASEHYGRRKMLRLWIDDMKSLKNLPRF